MFESISPKSSYNVKRLITYLCKGAEELSHAKRSALITRYDHIYGDLSGQRALTLKDIASCTDQGLFTFEFSTISFVLALETHFATICNIISASALSDTPTTYLRSIATSECSDFESLVRDVITGTEHVRQGLRHYKDAFELDWYTRGLCPDVQQILRELLLAVAELWEGDAPLLALPDPIQIIHDETFPRNLVHVTGQFYTPPWMCDLLAADAEIEPDSLVMDPFCGSGAFLLSALKTLAEKGVPIERAMQQVMGIDLNPSACIAARTNLVLYARKAGIKNFGDLPINILCADSLAPAVTQGEAINAGLFDGSLARIIVDGEIVVADPNSKSEITKVTHLLENYAVHTATWFEAVTESSPRAELVEHGCRERNIAEHLAAFMVRRADVVLTNPPWVGWEYMSRPYRDYLNPAWGVYSLFEQKGLQAAFLKEDISTLCVATACDRYLKHGGNAALVIRPAAMQSDLAARGLRRLSLFVDSGYLQLHGIRLFEDLQVFGNAAAPAAVWQLKKQGRTNFPVPVRRWVRRTARWQPHAATSLADVVKNVSEESAVCSPSNPDDITTRWTIGNSAVDALRTRLVGSNDLQPRIGFFTGGANAVYYLQPLEVNGSTWRCENITERAKRHAEKVTCNLEADLIYSVVRGRDLAFWSSEPEVFVLCPHNRETKLYPLGESVMINSYPMAYFYLKSMKNLLTSRKGFAGWEKKIHQDYFYTLQRIGDYTFAPFKVCWSYISEDFVVSVIGMDERGKPIFPNDKVVFIPFEDPEEAYFTAGVLSSAPIRLSVVSSISSRQVSTSVIRHLMVPKFDRHNTAHLQIAAACRDGHCAMASGLPSSALSYYEVINELTALIFGLSPAEMEEFRKGLLHTLGFYPFRIKKNRAKTA